MRRYIFLLFIIGVGFSVEDVQKEHVVLNWEVLTQEDGSISAKFQDAFYEAEKPLIPLFTKIIELHDKSADLAVIVENKVFESVEEPAGWEDFQGPDVFVETRKIFSGDNGKLHLKITPFKKENHQLYLLKSFDIKTLPMSTKSVKRTGSVWKEESVLNSGKWVKISVEDQGVHKIPYSKLEEWGFSDPQKVSVFGSGAEDLPENPADVAYDDLVQNGIWHGNSNGTPCLFFFAQGINEWRLNSAKTTFSHSINPYTKKGFYFLTDAATVKKIELLSEEEGDPALQVFAYNAREIHEEELVNVLEHGSGRQWFGESFRNNSSRKFNFKMDGLEQSEEVHLRIRSIGRSFNNSRMEIFANGTKAGELNFSKVNTSSHTTNYADAEVAGFRVPIVAGQLETELVYKTESSDNNAIAWLDFIEVNFRKKLEAGNEPVFFRDLKSVGTEGIVEFVVENCSASSRIFDVTDIHTPKEIPYSLSGSKAFFKRSADQLHEYVVLDQGQSFHEPVFAGEVVNQNLHGLGTPEFIIISHSDFVSAANQLADFHRGTEGMDVVVVRADHVYNEFSSGTANPTGIRNFIKMLYQKGTGLKYVLLFGDGSYDNRKIKSETGNFIPTYQSENSLSPTASFITDDYYVLLDDGESVYDGAVDLGIGRIPASTLFEAELVVRKIVNYYSPESFGSWKNIVCFIGDDEDGNLHMEDSEQLANYLNKNHQEFVTDKIYLDAYKQEVSPAGESYPDVTDAIFNRVKEGTMVLNYVGHANNRFMADERVLNISNVNTWSNSNQLPVFVTATCEFSRFDAEETSIGEYVLFNPNGGSIALFSTTRLVYAYSNFLLSRNFYRFVFDKDANGKRYRMGDIMRLAKSNTINTTNKRNFSLLGDPALKLAYPANKVVTQSINGKDAGEAADTVGALQRIDIEGYITDFSDNKLNDFNGEVEITVFDKEMELKTLGNGGEIPMSFKVQENVIYKGVAGVSNGDFSFSFVVPKDIVYNPGEGKIIYYATDETRDAGGAFRNVIIGGGSGNSVTDQTGPEIDLYMDSPSFQNGDKTSKSPTLLAFLSDENGINTAGTGIGHDITAVLDNDYSKILVLNEYYQANINDYTSGAVYFPLKDLTPGFHTLRLKAWDVANNSSEAEIEFEVSGEFLISNVVSYPNPVSDYTFFTLEHNQPGAVLEVIVEIIDQNGRRIDQIKTSLGSSGNVSNPIRWSMNESGQLLRNGIYLYRIFARNEEGLIASKSGKMMISR